MSGIDFEAPSAFNDAYEAGHKAGLFEAQLERDRLRSELEYAYRVVDFGFTYNTFDFSILRQRAADYLKETSSD